MPNKCERLVKSCRPGSVINVMFIQYNLLYKNSAGHFETRRRSAKSAEFDELLQLGGPRAGLCCVVDPIMFVIFSPTAVRKISIASPFAVRMRREPG